PQYFARREVVRQSIAGQDAVLGFLQIDEDALGFRRHAVVAARSQQAGRKEREHDSNGQQRCETIPNLHRRILAIIRTSYSPLTATPCPKQMPGPAELFAKCVIIALPARLNELELRISANHAHLI